MNIKKISILLALPVAMLFSACDQDNMGATYTYTTQGVSFGTTNQGTWSLPSDYTTQSTGIEVLRSESNGAASIGLAGVLSNGNPLPAGIQIPSTVEFADGEFTAIVPITVDNTLANGGTYQVVLMLDDAQATDDVQSMTQTVVTIFRDYSFTSLGKGHYSSWFFGYDDNKDNIVDRAQEFDVEVQKADQVNMYQAVDLYEAGYNVRFQVANEADDKGRYRVTVARQAALSDLSGYGTTYVSGSGLMQNGVINVTLEFTVSAGSFGTAPETLVLPVTTGGETPAE